MTGQACRGTAREAEAGGSPCTRRARAPHTLSCPTPQTLLAACRLKVFDAMQDGAEHSAAELAGKLDACVCGTRRLLDACAVLGLLRRTRRGGCTLGWTDGQLRRSAHRSVGAWRAGTGHPQPLRGHSPAVWSVLALDPPGSPSGREFGGLQAGRSPSPTGLRALTRWRVQAFAGRPEPTGCRVPSRQAPELQDCPGWWMMLTAGVPTSAGCSAPSVTLRPSVPGYRSSALASASLASDGQFSVHDCVLQAAAHAWSLLTHPEPGAREPPSHVHSGSETQAGGPVQVAARGLCPLRPGQRVGTGRRGRYGVLGETGRLLTEAAACPKQREMQTAPQGSPNLPTNGRLSTQPSGGRGRRIPQVGGQLREAADVLHA